jgi:hypothetical protein
VETDKGHRYFVACRRDLWNWDRDCVPADGSTATRFKCQYANGSPNKRHGARFSRWNETIIVIHPGCLTLLLHDRADLRAGLFEVLAPHGRSRIASVGL